jgi:hypothetical protein
VGNETPAPWPLEQGYRGAPEGTRLPLVEDHLNDSVRGRRPGVDAVRLTIPEFATASATEGVLERLIAVTVENE